MTGRHGHRWWFAIALALASAGCQDRDESAVETPSPAAPAADHAAHGTAPAETTTMTISPERLQEIGVRFEIAEKRPLTRTIRTVGRIEIDERRLANVNIKIEGWIDRLYVSATGDHVRKGQVLFTLYSPELVATQQEYLLALQSVRDLGRSEFPEVAQGAQSLLEVTRRRLLLWDIPEHHIEDLERTGQVLKTLPIHAPMSGTVIERKALAGMYVRPGDQLYTIADLTSIWALADIYEYELPLIRVGQIADVTLSYDPQTHFEARVDFIYPTIDPQARTAKVRFKLANPEERLKPDMYANVELKIPLGTRLAVPKDAVLETGERRIIFIHHGGGKLEWRNVRTGLRADGWVEVTEGLEAGDHIVTSANFLIDSESQLKAAVGGMAGMKH
ncbi:MAG TPA: efflux RND transporter periplasmic adaptor subunit [Methylococcus sp.]|nr:efflux RND transporter periplasmic adaptor subunit [Methylococcus sp.]